MRRFLFSQCLCLCLSGLCAGQDAGGVPPFRPLCERFASPFEQMDSLRSAEEERTPGGSVPAAGYESDPVPESEEKAGGFAGMHHSGVSPQTGGALDLQAGALRLGQRDVADAPASDEMPEPGGETETVIPSDSPQLRPEVESQGQGDAVSGAVAKTGPGVAVVQSGEWDPASLPSVRCKVLLAGDTMMEDFALQLNRDIRPRRGYFLKVVTRRSACLSSSGRFRFSEKLDDAITENDPDVIVLLLGCWDDVAIRTDDGYAMLGTPAWEAAYRERVRGVLEVLQRHAIPAVWVGLPVMGSKNAETLHRLTAITRELVKDSPVYFIDNMDLLADAEGRFQTRESRPGFPPVLLRRRDGKHTTRAGDERMVKRFLPVFSRIVQQVTSQRVRSGGDEVSAEDLPMSDVHTQLFR